MSPPDPKAPVTILGAGIVGICTALSLLERGVPVTLIDKGAPGQETSLGNAGVVSPWSFIPQSMPSTWKQIPKLMFGYGRPLSIHPRMWGRMIPWGLRFLGQGKEDNVRANALAMSHLCAPSVELFRKHLSGTGHEDLLVDSYYVHASRTPKKVSLNNLDYRIRAGLGADMEAVGRAELAHLEPALSPEFQAAVVIKGQARARSPGRLGQVLADKALSMGAQIHRAEIREISRIEAGWLIRCTNETHAAKRVVVCLGVWSADLIKGLVPDVHLMSERGYHAEFQDPGIEVNNSILDVDGKVVASSMEGGVRVAGHAEFAPIDAPPSEQKKAQLLKIAKGAFPGLNLSKPTFWMGRRPSFPDSLPMIDAIADHPGLYLNFGHSHYGLMMSPASGELAARLLCGERPNTDLAPYSASRFAS